MVGAVCQRRWASYSAARQRHQPRRQKVWKIQQIYPPLGCGGHARSRRQGGSQRGRARRQRAGYRKSLQGKARKSARQGEEDRSSAQKEGREEGRAKGTKESRGSQH